MPEITLNQIAGLLRKVCQDSATEQAIRDMEAGQEYVRHLRENDQHRAPSQPVLTGGRGFHPAGETNTHTEAV